MFKYIGGIVLFLSAALAAMYFWIGVPSVYQESAHARVLAPHAYKNPDRAARVIDIAAFYFVPSGKTPAEDWREVLDRDLEVLKRFHALQFRGASELRYRIYPEYIEGEHDTLFYDTEITARGNPKALLSVSEELDRRVFSGTGDKFRDDFLHTSSESYPVFLVMYEGVGASGGVIYDSPEKSAEDIARSLGLPANIIYPVEISHANGFLLVSRTFFSDPHYTASVMAHEFYHTLGIPDEYSVSATGTREFAFSSGIMGSGRRELLEHTFLEQTFLDGMGFAP